MSQQEENIFQRQIECYDIAINTYYSKEWSDFTMQPHIHKWVEIMYVATGSAQVILDDEQHSLQAGDLILIDFGVPHALLVSGGQKSWILNIEFEVLIDRQSSVLLDSRKYILLHNAESIYNTLKDVILEISKYRDHELINLSMKYILGKISRLYRDDFQQKSSPELSYVKRAIDFMYCNYHRTIKIQEISDHIYLSENYFQRIFKKHAGKTPVEFLLDLRLEKARSLLIKTDMKIEDIYDCVGIRSRQYFYERYKSKYGETPSQTRYVRIADNG